MEVKKLLIAVWLCLLYNTSNAQSYLNCENALEVLCNTGYSIDIGQEPDQNLPFEGCSFYLQNPVWFRLEGTGEVFNLKLCSQVSSSVFLLTGSCNEFQCRQLDNSAFVYDCSFVFENRIRTSEDETYFIIVNPDYPGVATLDLRLDCVSAAPNDECEDAIVIQPGESRSFDGRSCTSTGPEFCGYFQKSGDLWYQFTGTGEPVVFNTSSFLITASFFEGECGNLICLSPTGIGRRTGYLTESGRTYFLQVHVLGDEEYHFSVDEISIGINSFCENALEMPVEIPFAVDFSDALYGTTSCRFDGGPIKYYKVNGDGRIFNISFPGYIPTILEGSCDQPLCPVVTLTDRLSFLTSNGVEYFVGLRGDPYSPAEFYAEFSSLRVVNDSFENALPILCGDSLTGTLRGALFDPVVNEHFEGPPDVWYKIEGDDYYVFFEVQLETPGFSGTITAEVFQLISDDQLERPRSFFDGIGHYFLLQSGVTYFVRVSGSPAESFTLKAKCRGPAENDGCSSAIPIMISDTTRGINGFGAVNTIDPCPVFPQEDIQSDIWYQVRGDGRLYEFNFERGTNGANYAIYTGSCESLECLLSVPFYDYREKITANLFLEDNRDYFIKIFNTSSNSHDQHFTFYFKELVLSLNDQPCQATLLGCGDLIQDSTTNALNNDRQCDGSLGALAGIWYKIEGNNKFYELISAYDPGADLVYSLNPILFSGTCDQLKCEADKLYRYQNKFVFYGRKGMTYYLQFNDVFPVRLTFNCVDDLGNDLILKAKRIVPEVTYQGYAFNAKREDYALCGGRSDAQKDIWFRTIGNDQFLFVNEGVDFLPVNSYLGQVYTKQSIFYQCMGSFEGNRFFLRKGVEYYIRLIIGEPALVSGYSSDFQVTFTFHSKIEFDDCSTAYNLSCEEQLLVNTNYATDDVQNICGEGGIGNRNIWFTVEGDNSFKELEITRPDGNYTGTQVFVFSGECHTLECLGTGNFVYAESGKNYFFNVVSGGFSDEILVRLLCSQPAVNDLCDQATAISCGETRQGTFNNVLPCDYADPCEQFTQYKRVWFRFTGNGDLAKLTLNTNQFNSHLVRLAVFQGDCCQPREISYDFNSDPTRNSGSMQEVFFYAGIGESYLIAVEQLFVIVESSEFSLTLTCLPPGEYPVCENAMYLPENEMVNLDLGDYYRGSIYNPLSGLARWKGSGGEDTLMILGGLDIYPVAFFTLLPDGECTLRKSISNSVATEIFRDEEKVTYILPSEKDEEYLIRIERNPNYESISDKIPLLMRSAQSQNSCDVVLPTSLELTSTESSFVLPYQMSGIDFPVNIFISDGANGPTYFATLNGMEPLEFPNNFSPGLKLLEVYNNSCHTYGTFEIVYTDLPDHICPDSLYCPDILVHLEVPVSTNKYQAQHEIETKGQLHPGSEVIYQAGELIELKPGFEVPQGSVLQIQIGGCREDDQARKLKRSTD